MKRISAAFLIIAAALPLGAQTTQKLQAGKPNEYALIYSLPTTTLDITLEAEKTVRTPGEFFRYAKKYLGVDPITEPSSSYELKSVIVNPRGITDPEERYQVQFKSGSTPFMMIDGQNVPLSVNYPDVSLPEPPGLPAPREAKPTILEMPVAKQAVTAEMLQSPSSAKRAELAAARIYELRETRSDILSGNADNMPADGQAMQLVLDNLSAQEAALTAMFAGTRSSRTEVERISIRPDSTGLAETVLARISAVDGIVDSDNLAGAPVTVAVKIIEQGILPVTETGATKTFPKGGIAYNIPGRALVTVSYGGNEIAEEEVPLAQAGVVFGLDPKLFTDKKAPSKALFDPTTGALVEIGPAN